MFSASIASNAIWGPIFALWGLTAVVMALTLRERIRQFRAQRLHPQKVATRAAFAAAIQDTRCADNFSNLFETPVLFYVACLGIYVTHNVSMSTLSLAWLYVVLRVGHSVVQCGSNHVMTRFKVFAASLATLLALWLLWGWALLTSTQ